MIELRNTTAEPRLTTRQLQYISAALAYIVAALHLFHPRRGFPRLVLILGLDDPMKHLLYDPRPAAFVVSALAILIGVKLVLFGFPRKPIYVAGMALMTTYIVGYLAWHLTGHGGFLPGRDPLYHGLHPVEALIEHLIEYPIARAAKIAEALLLAVLALLYSREE